MKLETFKYMFANLSAQVLPSLNMCVITIFILLNIFKQLIQPFLVFQGIKAEDLKALTTSSESVLSHRFHQLL